MTMDQITRRAVSRLCEGKGTEAVLRIYAKARALRERRAAMAFLSRLRAPVAIRAQDRLCAGRTETPFHNEAA